MRVKLLTRIYLHSFKHTNSNMSTNLFKGIVFCALLSIIGCKNRNDNITITISDAVEVSFDEIATDIQITPLEADCPVDEVDISKKYGDILFVHSYNNAKIYMFDHNKLISTLDSRGRGHGEYTNIHTFEYSPENGMLYVATGNDKSILWYEVPSMSFQGQTELTDFPIFMKLLNNNSFLTCQERNLCSVNISTGESNVICSLSKVAAANTQSTFDSFSSENKVFSLCDEHNVIYTIDDGLTVQQLEEINFGDDGIPEKYIDSYNNPKDVDKIIEGKLFEAREHYLDGVWMTHLLDGGYEFWYCNYNAPEGDKDYYRLYRNINGKVSDLKGFRISGIKDQICPDGFENDHYYLVLSGPSDVLADPDEEPSELAKRIFKAVDSQPDFNPVIMTWKM